MLDCKKFSVQRRAKEPNELVFSLFTQKPNTMNPLAGRATARLPATLNHDRCLYECWLRLDGSTQVRLHLTCSWRASVLHILRIRRQGIPMVIDRFAHILHLAFGIQLN